jgi:hypothetical protein
VKNKEVLHSVQDDDAKQANRNCKQNKKQPILSEDDRKETAKASRLGGGLHPSLRKSAKDGAPVDWWPGE